MAGLVRKCTQCGTVDRKVSWKSMAEAAGHPEYERAWTCGSCAWTEFELVSDETEGQGSSGSATEVPSA